MVRVGIPGTDTCYTFRKAFSAAVLEGSPIGYLNTLVMTLWGRGLEPLVATLSSGPAEWTPYLLNCEGPVFGQAQAPRPPCPHIARAVTSSPFMRR